VASKKSTIASCPVTRGEVDLSKYEKLDGVWRELGISAPARRALVDAKILKLSDLSKIKLEDLTSLHGMGPKTIKTLKAVGAKFKK
jgi:DNA repair protein RadC